MQEGAGFPVIGVERAKLHSVLHEHLLKCSPTPEILFSHKLLKITSDLDSGPLQAHFRDCDVVLEGDIIVGADGVKSRVRDSVVFPY